MHSFWGSLLFRSILLLVLLGLQTYVYLRLLRYARRWLPHRRWVIPATRMVFLCAAIAIIIMTALRPRLLDLSLWLRVAAFYPFYIWFTATTILAIVLLLGELLKLPFRLMVKFLKSIRPANAPIQKLVQQPAFQSFDATRRLFLRRGVEGLSAVAFLGSTYGVVAAREQHESTEETFSLETLDPAFDGFTIALVSDVHSSVFMPKADMDRYVALINGLHADMIVVAGDFVTSFTDEVYPFAESFSGLHAPSGVFGVMGNHDFYVSNPDEVAREVTSAGIQLLHDEHVTLQRGDAAVQIVGIDDTGFPGRAEERLKTALGSKPLPGAKILLCHRPYFLTQAADRDIDLMLSGHTHGGQIVLASLGSVKITPAALASRYIAGVYRDRATAMYVSRGIGTVGMPIRINCPPEITRITLRSTRKPPQPPSETPSSRPGIQE